MILSRRNIAAVSILTVTAIMACRDRDRDRPAAADASSSASLAAVPVADAASAVPTDRWSDEGMLAEGVRYMDDPAFRRATLVECLVNPTNTYSRQRIDNYALNTKAWDLLPEWNPISVQATRATAEDLRAHRPVTLDASSSATPLWDGKRPSTKAGWVALGREVFFRYPLRVEVFMNWALEHPTVGERVGVRPAADGTYPGVVVFSNLEGKASLGITCAICHTNVKESGAPTVIGEARRAFDYGALRLAFHADTKTPVEADLARRMKTWGPGRADVTEDDDEDPVSIPDLWGLRHQTFLTQAGTIKHVGPTALAIRQETQLLHSNHQKIRPPRELAFALAMYLYSLEPPSKDATANGVTAANATNPDALAHGKDLFGKYCKGCHSNDALGGPPVPAERVGTDASFAKGKARGTGFYRPPALIRVASAAPYFHNGGVPTLDDVLSTDRLQASYTKNPFRKGAVVGHTYGTELPKDSKAALLAYLRDL